MRRAFGRSLKGGAQRLLLRSEGAVNSTTGMSRSSDGEWPLKNLEMKTRIYVGNLAYTATATDIRKLFSPFGEVAAAHVFTAGKRRFGFVLMTNEADGESAIEALNGGEFFGRELVVQWAAKQRLVRFKVDDGSLLTHSLC